jgi:hypothetical protein
MKADPLSYSSININNGTRIRKKDLAFFAVVGIATRIRKKDLAFFAVVGIATY